MNTVRLFLAVTCFAWMAVCKGSPNAGARIVQSSEGISITSSGSRPVAYAAIELIRKYGYPINYEDPRYEYHGDFKDVAADVVDSRDELSANERSKVMVPRGGSVSVQSKSSDPAEILRELVGASTAETSGGRFTFVEYEGYLNILPTESRDSSGRWHAQQSILDTKISIPIENRTEHETIDAICGALTLASRIPVRIGDTGFYGETMDDKGEVIRPIRLGAESEMARDVLIRALRIIGGERSTLTWHIYFSPMDQAYVMNLIEVPADFQNAGHPVEQVPKKSGSSKLDSASVPLQSQ